MTEKANEYLEQGTDLAGYEAHGPYHCEDCEHLKNAVCVHPIVALDPKLKHPREGQTTVDVEHGCCRYVKQAKEKEADDLPSVIRKATK